MSEEQRGRSSAVGVVLRASCSWCRRTRAMNASAIRAPGRRPGSAAPARPGRSTPVRRRKDLPMQAVVRRQAPRPRMKKKKPVVEPGTTNWLRPSWTSAGSWGRPGASATNKDVFHWSSVGRVDPESGTDVEVRQRIGLAPVRPGDPRGSAARAAPSRNSARVEDDERDLAEPARRAVYAEVEIALQLLYATHCARANADVTSVTGHLRPYFERSLLSLLMRKVDSGVGRRVAGRPGRVEFTTAPVQDRHGGGGDQRRQQTPTTRLQPRRPTGIAAL